MMRIIVLMMATILMIGYVYHVTFSQSKNALQRSIKIDGVYTMVSETTNLKSPKIVSKTRKNSEWSGLYNFQNGHFSINIMDKRRKPDWFLEFPENAAELGYESFAGTYEVTEKKLNLKSSLALNPFLVDRIRQFEVKIANDILILTEKIYPYPENMSEGQRIIVLQKLK